MSLSITKDVIYQKSPQELTALLYEVCINNLENALTAIEDKKFLDANECLKKANDIVERLGTGLNYEAGIIADQLDSVYSYIAEKLIEANLKKDVKVIEHILYILQEIKSAWQQALVTKKDTAAKMTRQSKAYEQNIMVED